MLRRLLLACGIASSLLYAATDIVAAARYPDYHSFTARVISELMAVGAPTERLVDPLFLLYGVLMMGFAVGVWKSGRQRRVRLMGVLLFAYAVIGLFGPTLFEMNVRGTGDPARDVAHIVLTGVLAIFILASVGLGASIQRRGFRLYSLATLLIMIAFGILTSFAARGLETGQPTPWIGLAERINIAAFLLWVAVLAVSVWRAPPIGDVGTTTAPGTYQMDPRPA